MVINKFLLNRQLKPYESVLDNGVPNLRRDHLLSPEFMRSPHNWLLMRGQDQCIEVIRKAYDYGQ